MAWNDELWSARMEPKIRPVSCCGKNPLGMLRYKVTLSAITASKINHSTGPCRKDQASDRLYHRVQRTRLRPRRGGSGLNKPAHIIGVVVSETTSEIRMAADNTMANSWNKRPSTPPISNIGMNTAISDRLMEMTVKPISREPVSAACQGEAPRSM